MKILLLGLIAVLLVGGFVWYSNMPMDEPQEEDTSSIDEQPEEVEEPEPTPEDEPDEPAQPTASLLDNAWQWKETQYSNDDVVTSLKPDAFVLTFMEGNRFSATTDCNNASGNYIETDGSLIFSQMATTKMACLDETQEAAFLDMLEETESYRISQDKELVLIMKLGTGSVIFTPIEEE